jgi:hypothetical protein
MRAGGEFVTQPHALDVVEVRGPMDPDRRLQPRLARTRARTTSDGSALAKRSELIRSLDPSTKVGQPEPRHREIADTLAKHILKMLQ